MQQRESEPFTVVVPARFASSRLPGKPLADIGGRPMVMHVWDSACRSGAAEVVVATDDQRIVDAAAAFGATVLLTSADHASGTDRIAEAARLLELPDDRIVVNVQGDEPLIPPELIAQVAELLAGQGAAQVATLTTPFAQGEDPASPNFVKVVTDERGFALYFSRAVIPFARDAGGSAAASGGSQRHPALRRHVGIYAYRVSALRRLAQTPVCELEAVEMLEQLRCLWLGMRIAVADACALPPRGVDTPEDLAEIRKQISRGIRNC